MRDKTYTPGPWQTTARNTVTNTYKRVIAICPDVDNAQFIAAAPELADALLALLDWGREHTSPIAVNSPHKLLIAAHAALAKAGVT